MAGFWPVHGASRHSVLWGFTYQIYCASSLLELDASFPFLLSISFTRHLVVSLLKSCLSVALIIHYLVGSDQQDQ